MKLLSRAHALLEAKGVSHALIGAAAMAVRGVSRSTLDLDLLVTDRVCLDPPTWDELTAEGITVTIREGDHEDPLGGVIRLSRSGDRSVDVVLGRSAWQVEVIQRAAPELVGGEKVPVALAADLVLLKLFAGGMQDRWDIQQLLAGPERAAIIEAVRGEIAKLPARSRRLWRELLL